MPLNNAFEDLARVLDKVEAVSNLNGLRRSGTHPTGIFPGAVPRDNFNSGVLFQPGGGRLSGAVRQQINDGMGLTIGQDRAVDLAFVKRKVVDAQDARRGRCGKGGRMGAPQQGVAAGRHCGARALPGSCLATKRQREIAERRIQTECALRGGGEKGRQALTEGGGWTGRSQAAKATQLEQEKRRLTADGQVIRPTCVIAMYPGRDSTAMRACGTRRRDKCW